MRKNGVCLRAACLVTILFYGLQPSRAEIFSARDALAFAYANSPKLEAARAKLRATDQEVSRANAGWKPTIAATGSAGIQERRTNPAGAGLNGGVQPLIGQISVIEPIYRGGRTLAGVRQAKALVQAGRAELTTAEAGVLLSAITSYMDVIRDRKIFEARRQNLSLLTTQVAAVREMNRLRAATLTDMAQSEARLARSRSDLSQARAQLTLSLSLFEQNVGRPAETLEEESLMPAIPGDIQGAIESAVKLHPSVVATQENERAAEFGVDIAVGALLPEVSLQLQYQKSRDDLTSLNIRNELSVGAVMLQARIPLFQGGAEYAAVREAKEVSSQYHYLVRDTQARVRQVLMQALGNLEASRVEVFATGEQLRASRAALDGVSEGQKGGERSILDVLNATQELVEAQVASAIAARNHAVAVYQMLEALGQLSAASLKLPGPRYDPEISYHRAAEAWFDLGK